MTAGVNVLSKQIDEMCRTNPALIPMAIRLLRVTVSTLQDSDDGGGGRRRKKKREKVVPPTAPPPPPPPPVPPVQLAAMYEREEEDEECVVGTLHSLPLLKVERERETPDLPNIMMSMPQTSSDGEFINVQTSFPLVSAMGTQTRTERELSKERHNLKTQLPSHHHHHHDIYIGGSPPYAKPTQKSGFMSHIRELRGGPSDYELAVREQKKLEWLASLDDQVRENRARREAERRQTEEMRRLDEQRFLQQRANLPPVARVTAYDHRTIIPS
eukprot:TRINITY_DN943_c0_g1_i1.p1 TRINITY_DN943_c0_g1~~TRINITY_DN943_c0_g1_i1.p1  ORF type:complete len:271 (+),score=88.84 TRINITY_DN943_c0_g1_i1:46-858(+)